jgi:SOS-response transcriptional repressor LexA
MLEPKNFNPKLFRKLLDEAIGDNSITGFANKSGVDRTYLSKYLNLNLKKAPTPKIIKKISENSSVNYNDLMVAAGYLDQKYMRNKNLVIEYLNQFDPEKAESIKKIKNDKYKDEIVFLYNIKNPIIWKKENNYDYKSENYDYFAANISLRADFGIKIGNNEFNDLGFLNGDILLVEIKETVASGSTVLVMIKKNNEIVDRTIKRYYKLSNDKIRLEPDKNMNSIYDKSEVQIVGLVFTIRRDLEV